jgi:hypothetical protein
MSATAALIGLYCLSKERSLIPRLLESNKGLALFAPVGLGVALVLPLLLLLFYREEPQEGPHNFLFSQTSCELLRVINSDISGPGVAHPPSCFLSRL